MPTKAKAVEFEAWAPLFRGDIDVSCETELYRSEEECADYLGRKAICVRVTVQPIESAPTHESDSNGG